MQTHKRVQRQLFSTFQGYVQHRSASASLGLCPPVVVKSHHHPPPAEAGLETAYLVMHLVVGTSAPWVVAVDSDGTLVEEGRGRVRKGWGEGRREGKKTKGCS